MNRSLLNSVIRGAEALAARDGVGARPDAELLRRFTADRDAAAFAVLVRRHGPLVWGVCRNLLPADPDAEDAFQATFLALVRSAATVRNTEALGGWLHGVAYRVSMKARRSAARRKQRESAAAVPDRDTPVADAAWDELQAAVHEEVCKLPEKLRLPFVLCGLQGRPQKEAAKQLGWKVGTISARLTSAPTSSDWDESPDVASSFGNSAASGESSRLCRSRNRVPAFSIASAVSNNNANNVGVSVN